MSFIAGPLHTYCTLDVLLSPDPNVAEHVKFTESPAAMMDVLLDMEICFEFNSPVIKCRKKMNSMGNSDILQIVLYRCF